MNKLLLLCCLSWSLPLLAQHPEFDAPRFEVEAHLRFLASDELQGRRTGAPGNLIAARYIADYFKSYGVQPVPGAEGYYQNFPIESVTPPNDASLAVGKTVYEHRKDFIVIAGEAADFKGTAIFAGYGWVAPASGHDDYQGLDVKGKVVFVISGLPDNPSTRAAFSSIRDKRAFAQQRGAAALIELYRLNFPWPFALNFFGRSSTRLADDAGEAPVDLPYGWLKEKGNDPVAAVVKGQSQKAAFSSSGASSVRKYVPNVLGLIEGADPELKNEYVLLSAHFDHVGTGKEGGGAFTEQDSIFNGARDNAMGTTALLLAARALSQHPPKRSVILMGCNGEELGLLGSQYYANNPLIPLNKVVYNINADGAGYNDTRYISALGFGRTGTDEMVGAAAAACGLEVLPNPVPEQGLYDRSDNVSFAAKGVPALSLSPGVTAFDEELSRYYHQVADEADSVDMDYLLKYCKTFVHAARLIADATQRPQWIKGDKYEEAGRTLYEE